MKTIVQLDYQAILANTAQPVHLAFQFIAPSTAGHRERPIAFSLVLDRSGSMAGPPLAAALTAAKVVVQNLRTEDQFSLVTFDNSAEVVIPIGPVKNKTQICNLIDRIVDGGSTNLTAGWMLGRDQLRGTPKDTVRRQLLLTDGLLNVGVIEPVHVKRVVCDGLERDGIRTSTLGFGDEYDEDLLSTLATTTGGCFYDANQADKLPTIFSAELDGLQKIAIQNLRIRFKALDFVDAMASMGGYTEIALPDGRHEYAIGDLMSDEERVAVFALSVLPIPLLAGSTTPAANLDGEALVEVEILYDSIEAAGIVSHSERHLIRVRPTQAPEDIQLNASVLPWVSSQQAAKMVTEALKLRDQDDLIGARKLLSEGITQLKAYSHDEQTKDGLNLLESALRQLEDPAQYVRSRKALSSMSVQYCKMSSTDEWVSEAMESPSFKKPRNRRPPTPRPTDQTTTS
ncbi:MAG: VWA domain-containing protein [Cephaloticoccus sp.]|nr:VWA domain-containing protein [Cephaloticoccus sp.]